MKLSKVAAMLGGACAIYVVMAACGSGGGGVEDSVASSGGPGGGGSSAGGMPPGASSGIVDAFMDMLTDPVPDAIAAPPDVHTEPCSTQYSFTPTGAPTMVTVAEHLYPGKTKADLSALHAIAHYASSDFYYTSSSSGSTYQDVVANVLVRDGAAAVICQIGVSSASFDSVTFVLP